MPPPARATSADAPNELRARKPGSPARRAASPARPAGGRKLTAKSKPFWETWPSRTSSAKPQPKPARSGRRTCCRIAACVGIALASSGVALLLAFDPKIRLQLGLPSAHSDVPESLQPYRPLLIRVVNAADRGVARLLGRRPLVPTLDADALIDEACQRFVDEKNTNRTRCAWGDAPSEYGNFREGLDILIESLHREADLTLIGRVFASHRISSLLDQRLRLVEHWTPRGSSAGERRRHAERAKQLRAAAPRAPLFVVGLPRTGTSFLHTLLSQDDASFRAPLNWMVVGGGAPSSIDPLHGSIHAEEGAAAEELAAEDRAAAAAAAPGGLRGRSADEVERLAAESRKLRESRIAEATTNLGHFKSLAPGVDAQHTMTAYRPEECIVFQSHTFVAWEFVTYFNVPTYATWVRDRGGGGYSDVFRWHRAVLSHLGTAAPPSAAALPWVLKTPFYTGMLEDIVAAYPDARVVMTHRKPVTSLASLANLQTKLRSVASDRATPRAVMEEVLQLWDPMAARAVKLRQAWAWDEAHKGRVVDVDLKELHTDPMAAVRRIYDAFGLVLAPASEAKMRRWLADNGREKHGKNAYDRAWFGVGDDDAVLKEYSGLRAYDRFYAELFEAPGSVD